MLLHEGEEEWELKGQLLSATKYLQPQILQTELNLIVKGKEALLRIKEILCARGLAISLSNPE